MAQVWTIIRNTGEWAKLERGAEIKDVTCPKDMRRRAFSKGLRIGTTIDDYTLSKVFKVHVDDAV
jgi:hypothetical protein